MAVITTGSHPKALWPGVKDFFGQLYDEWATEYTYLFEVESSQQAYEELVKTHGFGLAPIKTEGASVSYTSNAQLWVQRATHKAYALGYIVTYEELRDNLYDRLSRKRARSLSFSCMQTVETVAAQVYNRATNASYTFGDGVVMLSTAHPDATGSTFSNKLATDADMSEASVEDICILIETAKDDSGLQIKLMPKILLYHPNDCFNAERIMASTLQNDTANNAVNALRSRGIIPDYQPNHYFTDTDAFFIRTNCDQGMVMFTREGVPTPTLEQDNEFNTKNALASAYFRFEPTMGDPRGVYGTTGA